MSHSHHSSPSSSSIDLFDEKEQLSVVDESDAQYPVLLSSLLSCCAPNLPPPRLSCHLSSSLNEDDVRFDAIIGALEDVLVGSLP